MKHFARASLQVIFYLTQHGDGFGSEHTSRRRGPVDIVSPISVAAIQFSEFLLKLSDPLAIHNTGTGEERYPLLECTSSIYRNCPSHSADVSLHVSYKAQ